MTTTTAIVTEEQAEAVLQAVAAWLGRQGYGTWVCPQGRPVTVALDHADADGGDCMQHGHAGPAPTGAEAARCGDGPMLDMAWDWSGRPTPTVLLEGDPYDWAIECASAVQRACPDVFVEPYAGYALSIYPA